MATLRQLILEETCPYCNDPQAYVGLNDVECPNRKCKAYSKRQEQDVRPASARSFGWDELKRRSPDAARIMLHNMEDEFDPTLEGLWSDPRFEWSVVKGRNGEYLHRKDAAGEYEEAWYDPFSREWILHHPEEEDG